MKVPIQKLGPFLKAHRQAAARRPEKPAGSSIATLRTPKRRTETTARTIKIGSSERVYFSDDRQEVCRSSTSRETNEPMGLDPKCVQTFFGCGRRTPQHLPSNGEPSSIFTTFADTIGKSVSSGIDTVAKKGASGAFCNLCTLGKWGAYGTSCLTGATIVTAHASAIGFHSSDEVKKE